MKLPNADRAEVDLRKLIDYSLSTTHPVGKNKAFLFARVLGLTEVDAALLRDALLTAAKNEEAVLGRNDKFGQRYRLDFEIVTAAGAPSFGPAGSFGWARTFPVW